MMWQPPYFYQPPSLPQPPPPSQPPPSPPTKVTEQPRPHSLRRTCEDWETGTNQEVEVDPVGDDQLNFLEEAEALELADFDPSVKCKEEWTTPKSLDSFLQKHFNRALLDAEREAIVKDYPKPKTVALSVPKLEDRIKDHLKATHLGAENIFTRFRRAPLMLQDHSAA